MHRKPTILLVGLILLTLTSFGMSQQVDIDLIISPTLQNARVVYVSSFDLLQQGATDFLFQLTIRSQDPERGQLVFRLTYGEEPLAEATTNDFELPAGIHNINNIQLSNGYRFPQNGEFVKFEDSQIKSPEDSDFETEVNQSGKLPAGTYQISVEFFSTSQQAPIGVGQQQLEVVSSAYVIPVAPGNAGGLSNPSIIYTEFPVFQFNSDLLPFGELDPFNVLVYKVLPDQHQTIDDVMTTTPHLDVSTSWTLFQYPQNSADDQGGRLRVNEFQPLTPGTYLWRVILNLQTTSGTEYIQSPVFGFKLVDANTVNENLVKKAAAMQVFNILRFLIGERANELENALSDFSLSGIMIDGQPIELEELYDKINQYADKVITIENIELLSSQE
jgi:hypothetical protein